MPAFRLKTKLVVAITGMVMVIVAALSALYISEMVQKRFQEADETSQLVAHQIFRVARGALEIDLNSGKVNLNDQAQVASVIQEVLQTDYELNALLDSVVGDSATIYDAAITDSRGQALLHTNAALFGTTLPERENFSAIVNGGIRKQLKVLYGKYDPSTVYNVRLPLVRGDKPFGEVRVGVSTVLLKHQIQDSMQSALVLSGSAIILSMLVAAILSNLALRPLAAISRRLDLISSGQTEALEVPSGRSDEYGAVSSKIEKLGRQMRDVKEVFSALKENLDQMMANLQDGVILFTSD